MRYMKTPMFLGFLIEQHRSNMNYPSPPPCKSLVSLLCTSELNLLDANCASYLRFNLLISSSVELHGCCSINSSKSECSSHEFLQK